MGYDSFRRDLSQLTTFWTADRRYGVRMDPSERLELVLAAAGLDKGAARPAELVLSYSNDTWLIPSDRGPAVLRVAWRGDRQRLMREAMVGGEVGESFGYPEVLGAGWVQDADLTYTLTRRLAGCSLATAWVGLDQSTRLAAVEQAVRLIQQLHRWRPSVEQLAALRPRVDGSALVADQLGWSIIPWGVVDPERLLAALGEVAGFPVSLFAPLSERVATDLPLLAEVDHGPVITHGDVHLDNLWWDGQQVSGLIDLEWVRPGPAWWDVARVADQTFDPDHPTTGAHQLIIDQLHDQHPEWSAIPDLQRRIELVQLGHAVRQVILAGSVVDDGQLDHPLSVIKMLLARRS